MLYFNNLHTLSFRNFTFRNVSKKAEKNAKYTPIRKIQQEVCLSTPLYMIHSLDYIQ